MNRPVPARVTVNRDAKHASMAVARRRSEGGGWFEPMLVRGNVMPRPASGREDQRREEEQARWTQSSAAPGTHRRCSVPPLPTDAIRPALHDATGTHRSRASYLIGHAAENMRHLVFRLLATRMGICPESIIARRALPCTELIGREGAG